MNESDLRIALRERADAFDPDPGWCDRIPVGAPARRRRATALASLLTAAAAAAIYLGVAGSGRSGIGDPDHADPTLQATAGGSVTIELAGYHAPVRGAMPRALRQHLDCMHEHGFDIPDPQWTGHGWMLTVEDARSLGVGTPRWKRTAFLTCALARPGGHAMEGLKHALLHPRGRGDKP